MRETMHVFIYQRARTAMQSGTANTHDWVLDFDTGPSRFVEPLMGWTGTRSTQEQLKLRFPTKEEAVAYAKSKGYSVEFRDPAQKKLQIKPYASNFAANRIRYADQA